MKIVQKSYRTGILSYQGQGHGWTSKVFPLYSNTYLSGPITHLFHEFLESVKFDSLNSLSQLWINS